MIGKKRNFIEMSFFFIFELKIKGKKRRLNYIMGKKKDFYWNDLFLILNWNL